MFWDDNTEVLHVALFIAMLENNSIFDAKVQTINCEFTQTNSGNLDFSDKVIITVYFLPRGPREKLKNASSDPGKKSI